MSITAIGNGDGALVAAELLQQLTQELSNDLSGVPGKATKTATAAAVPVMPASPGPALPLPAHGPAVSVPVVADARPSPISDLISLSLEFLTAAATQDHSLPGRTITNSVAPVGGAAVPAAPLDRLTQMSGPVTSPRQAPAPVRTADASLPVALAASVPQPLLPSKEDAAQLLLANVATSDLAKLTKILQPTPDQAVLDSLLSRALQELARGNAERAVGYLADYATRDPRRAETLPLEPGLDLLRGKIDALMNRMTIVAKMSAETGLSRAEQVVPEHVGKMPDWETHADVLLRLAHRFYELGGYANYSRSSDLSRLVSEGLGVSESKPARALAASAAASAISAPANPQLVPGMNVPYWAAQDISMPGSAGQPRVFTPRRYLSTPLDDVVQNLRDVQEIAAHALAQLWVRAPLLFLLSGWFSLGVVGGVAFAIGSRIWHDEVLNSVADFAFDLWGIGFLALICFGFYIRVMHRPRP